jgi:hypothetical protein
MRRLGFALVLVPLVIGAALLGRSAAQQPPFRPTAGRFEPGPLLQHDGLLCVLDTWTGRVHAAPPSAEPAEGVKAWVVDLPEAAMWERPLARDVSAGHVLQHGLPLAGTGAGAPVFAWQSVPYRAGHAPGIVDTRTGVHYHLVDGKVGPGCKVMRTDLRMLTRSVREVRTGAGGD